MNSNIRIKIEAFIQACVDSNLHVFPYVGLTELSTDRKTGKLNRYKYDSHLKAIKNCLKKRDIEILSPTSKFKDGMKEFMGIHNLFYVHLLKIKVIEGNGLSKDKAIKNLTTYLQWAEMVKGQTTYPSQVAYALFGEKSKARKIIKFENQKEPLQSVWGAAWDMLYLYLAQQFFPLENSETKMIFATNDEALWLIGSLFELRGAITNGGIVQCAFGVISYDFPHYDEFQEDIRLIDQKIKLAQAERITNRVFDPNLLKSERAKLERQINEEHANAKQTAAYNLTFQARSGLPLN